MTVHAKAVESINADTFIGFLKELRQIHKKIHHVPWEPFCAQVASVQVRQVSEGDVILAYLPKHTSHLNPVEIQWRVVPNNMPVQRISRNAKELVQVNPELW